MRRPPSVRGMWTAHHGDVLIAAFKTESELEQWVADQPGPDEPTTILVQRADCGIVAPDGTQRCPYSWRGKATPLKAFEPDIYTDQGWQDEINFEACEAFGKSLAEDGY